MRTVMKRRICLAALTLLAIHFVSSQPLTKPSTPWTFIADWWKKTHVPIFGSMLAGEYAPWGTQAKRDYYFGIIDRTGVTLADWADIRYVPNWSEAYANYLQDCHSRGLAVVGTLSMIAAYDKNTIPQELMPAVIRDPYGNLLEDNFPFVQQSFYHLSSLHPAWQKYVQNSVKTYIDMGVDGIMVDELAYCSVFMPDFNSNTVTEFRQYLLDDFTAAELQALGQRYNIQDFTTLDYAALIRSRLPAGRTSLTSSDWADWNLVSGLPLYNEFGRFLRIRNKQFAAHLIDEYKAYAQQRLGHEIPFSANINDLTSPEGLYMTDLLDYVDMECFYKDNGYFPKFRAVTSVRLAQALKKPNLLVTATADTDGDIVARGPALSTNLFKIMIAEAYATGSAFQVEEDLHGIKQDFDALAPYYRFSRDHGELFDDYAPDPGRIALLHLWETVFFYDPSDLRGLSQMLADSGYQFSLVFGAEEYLFWTEKRMVPAPNYPLDLETMALYPLLILPKLQDITESHAHLLLRYMEDGGRLVVFYTPEALLNLGFQRGTDGNITRLINYINAGPGAVGNGKIIPVNQILGASYLDNPQPQLLETLKNILLNEGFGPEVQMTGTKVSAYVRAQKNRFVVHFVNYDYAPQTDQATPVSSRQVSFEPPPAFPRQNLVARFYTPEGQNLELPVAVQGNTLTIDVPGFQIWGILTAGQEYTISGTVKKGTQGLGGVVMAGLPGNPTTDSSGYYHCQVNLDWSGSVTPAKEGYIFSPESRSYSHVASDRANEDYSASMIQHTLTMSAGSGGSTDPSPGSHSYDHNSSVSVRAVPNTNYAFIGWTGNVPAGHENDNPLNIIMNADKSLAASFLRLIHAPLQLTGQRVLNRSLSQAEYVDVLTWNPNPDNENIVKYRVCQIEGTNRKLLAEITGSPYKFELRKVDKNKAATYSVVAVNNEGREGDPASVTIQ